TSFSVTAARITSVPLALRSALPSGDRFAASMAWDSSPGFTDAWATASLTHRTPRAITTRAAPPANLDVATTHRRRRDIDDGVLVPESIVAIHLSSRVCHPRRPVDDEHVGIATRFERKRHRKMPSTRRICEDDVVGSPPIEVPREGNLFRAGGVQTEAKERDGGTMLRPNRVPAGQSVPGQRGHDDDEAECEGRRNIPAHDSRGPQDFPDPVPRSRPAIGQT